MTDPATGQRRSAAARGTTVVLPVLLVASLAVQCVALYAPQGSGVSPFPLSDKVVHLMIFAMPAVLAVLAGFRPVVVLGALGAQAVLSEVIQGEFLASRSGDPLDVVADLVGVGIGIVVGVLLVRRRERSRLNPSGAERSRW
ncbi:MAG: VanZ family protein [Ornithinibacter sp.]